MNALEEHRGAFIRCSWACGACGDGGGARGSVRPWRRPGETAEAAAARLTQDTRGRCVKGCAFTATADGEPSPNA